MTSAGTPSGAEVSRRRLLGLGGGLAAAAVLAACGAGRQTTAVVPSGPSAGVGVTLEQWYHQYGEAGTRQAAERYAAAYAPAKVDVVWKAGDYEQTVAATLPTEGAPDVFEYGNGPTIDMIRSGQVADLTAVFGEALADFNPALVERMTYRDKIWAVPQVMDMQLLVYRRSMLDAARVAPPTTMDELLDAAARLTRGRTKGLFLGNDGGADVMGGPMLRSAGFDFLRPDGTFGFDDPKAAAALGMLRTLARSGHVLSEAPDDWYAPGALVQGRTAMQFTGLWNLPDIHKAVGGDVGVLPWPAMDGGAANVTIGAYGACVNAHGKNVGSAVDFVRWLWVDGVDEQLDFATTYGLHIPARHSLSARSPVLADGPAVEAVTLAQRHGFVQSPLLWTPRCATAFGDMMTRIVGSGADPAAEIAALKKIVDAELARVRD